VRLVTVAAHEAVELVLGDPGQHGRVGDLVPIEVQDRQHDAVGRGVDELVRVPAGGERARLGLAVTDNGRNEQVGVVEGRAIGVRQRVAELAAFVDRAGSFGRDVRWDAARERELFEKALDTRLVVRDIGVRGRVGAVEEARRDQAGAAVPRADDVHGRLLARLDHAVEVRIEEVESRGGSPVANQARLDVVAVKRLAQQRIVEEVDLADAHVVGGTPPAVNSRNILSGCGLCGAVGPGVGRHVVLHSRGVL